MAGTATFQPAARCGRTTEDMYGEVYGAVSQVPGLRVFPRLDPRHRLRPGQRLLQVGQRGTRLDMPHASRGQQARTQHEPETAGQDHQHQPEAERRQSAQAERRGNRIRRRRHHAQVTVWDFRAHRLGRHPQCRLAALDHAALPLAQRKSLSPAAIRRHCEDGFSVERITRQYEAYL